ncbi:MAG: sulfite exporter TauE/SafE family protein [Pyrinomonadaceae bacterium]
MSTLFILILIFFLSSLVGVVTGSNSLITVPAMFQLGMDEKVAVATNMFGLVFMAVGGAIPFLRQGTVRVKELSPLIILTIIGSTIGAAITGAITNQAIKAIVTVAMIAVVAFTLLKKGNGNRDEKTSDLEPLKRGSGSGSYLLVTGFIVTFLLAIYGGLYSGGYVTVLTASFVAFFGMSYSESIAATKVINVFSSLVATLVFIYEGLVDFRLGLILGVTMFIAAYAGAHFATKMNELWLRRIFLGAVLILAAKTAFDLLSSR